MPDIKFATADVTAMKLGTTAVAKVYLGTTEVWPGAVDCTDVLTESFNNYTAAPWTPAGSPTFVAGRTASAVQLAGATTSARLDYSIPSGDRSATVTLGFAYRAVTAGSNHPFLSFWSDTNTTKHQEIRMRTDGSFEIVTGSSGQGTSAAGVIPLNTWVYFEVQLKMHDSTGIFKVQVNGTNMFNLTGADTKSGGTSTVYDTIRLGGFSTTGTDLDQFDDLYLSTGADCTFKGSQTIVVTPPTVTLPVTSGLQGWWDADDATTFTYSSGTVVSQWNDKSGNSRNVTQATAGNRPSRNGYQNGRLTVVYDGSDDQLGTAAPVTTATDNITMFLACHRTGGNTTTCLPLFNDSTGGAGYGIALRANNGNIGTLLGGVAWQSTSTPDPAAPGVYALRRSSGTWSLRLNGVATSLATTTNPTTPAGSTQVGIGNFGGPIYEALIYNRALSDVERADVETYLKTKWGTP